MNRGRARAPNSHTSFRGRGSRCPGAYSAPVRGPIGADDHFGDDSFGSEDRIPQGRGRNSQQRSLGYNSNHSDYKPKSSYVYRPKMPSPVTTKETVTQIGTFHPGKNSAEARDSASKQSDSANENDLPSFSAHSDSKEDVHLDARKSLTSQTPVEGADFPDKVNISSPQDESQLPSKFGYKEGIVQNRGTKGTAGNKDLEHSECSAGLQQRSLGNNSKHSDYKPKSSYAYQPKMPSPLTTKETVTQIGTFHPGKNSAEASDSASKQSDSANENDLPSFSAHSDSKEDVHLDARKSLTSQTPVEGADFPDKVNISSPQDESQLPSKFGSKEGIVQNRGTKGTAGNKDLEHSECSAGLQQRSLGNNSKHSDYKPKSSYAYQPKMPSPLTTKETVTQIGTFHPGKSFAEVRDSASKQSDSASENDLPSLSAHSDSKEDVHMEVRKSPTSQTPVEEADFPDKVNISSLQDESQLPSKFGSKVGIVQNQGTKGTAGNKYLEHSERLAGLQQRSLGNNSKHSDYKPKSSYVSQPKIPSPVTTKETVTQIGTFHPGKNSAEVCDSASKQSDSARENDLPSLSAHSDSKEDIHMEVRKSPTSQTPVEGANFPDKVNISSLQGESQLHSKFGSQAGVVQYQGTKSTAGNKDLQHSERSAGLEPFDICPTKSGTLVVLKPSLLVRNREKRNEIKLSTQGQNGSILRPGMVILKSYISLRDQVKIVKVCRDLGFGSGGFYQPSYRDGAKLHLKMMCLGKNWDPETSEYGDHRPIDDTIPPTIPDEFYQLVESAIKDSHALIKKDSKVSNAEDILPWMSPNICIVNFYSASGKLGLHQDRDESPESLRKCLPVVSFSIGDKAEFLYGDQRDPDKADKVELASGDVLIFGGKSRHVFHGVTAILPNTAPKALLEDTKLRPGRLNLTFRQF